MRQMHGNGRSHAHGAGTVQERAERRANNGHVERKEPAENGRFRGWGVQESNLRPLACRASALAD